MKEDQRTARFPPAQMTDVPVLPPGRPQAHTTQTQAAILRARAQALAKASRSNDDLANLITVVEFRLAHERYALEAAYVREIFALKVLTPVPCTPPFVLGIVNIRGQIISVIDLKKFFDLPEKGLTDINRIIILRTPHLEVGVLTDAILGVNQMILAPLHPPLPTLTSFGKEFLKGVTPAGVIVLAAERLLADKRMIVHEEIPG